MKQYRHKIKKELLQKSHAHRIGECCGKEEGPGGGDIYVCMYVFIHTHTHTYIYIKYTELNSVKHMYDWKQ
jgi:hypothetical protein